MTDTLGQASARVVAIRRYPVKSMMGTELNAADVTERGLLGDRAYALIDVDTGKVVSAKNPRKWGNLFGFGAEYLEPPVELRPLPPVRITFPDGSQATSADADLERRFTASLGRRVRLATSVPDDPSLEGYWPDHEWLAQRDQSFDVPLPPGTFFDAATVHLVTTATLDRLRALAPHSRFEARRFRPNLIVALPEGAEHEGFAENGWVGRTLALGGEVRIRVEGPCPRCVMTTLSQADLPKDPGVLRAVVEHNHGNVGVYAAVVRGGRVRRGDAVGLA
jgi:uncharacterized protein YcbX